MKIEIAGPLKRSRLVSKPWKARRSLHNSAPEALQALFGSRELEEEDCCSRQVGVKMLRVICTDPDATDSSSDEDEMLLKAKLKGRSYGLDVVTRRVVTEITIPSNCCFLPSCKPKGNGSPACADADCTYRMPFVQQGMKKHRFGHGSWGKDAVNKVFGSPDMEPWDRWVDTRSVQASPDSSSTDEGQQQEEERSFVQLLPLCERSALDMLSRKSGGAGHSTLTQDETVSDCSFSSVHADSWSRSNAENEGISDMLLFCPELESLQECFLVSSAISFGEPESHLVKISLSSVENDTAEACSNKGYMHGGCNEAMVSQLSNTADSSLAGSSLSGKCDDMEPFKTSCDELPSFGKMSGDPVDIQSSAAALGIQPSSHEAKIYEKFRGEEEDPSEIDCEALAWINIPVL